MKYKGFRFLWYDFWIGGFYDRKKGILYVCPLPCCVFEWQFSKLKDVRDGVPEENQ